LLFNPVIGIKRRTRLVCLATARGIKAHGNNTVSPLPAGLNSVFVPGLVANQLVGVEVIPNNEPLFTAKSAAPFWRARISRYPQIYSANLPMLYPFRRFSGLQGRLRLVTTEQGRSC